MSVNMIGISDLSENSYASGMKEFANQASLWSGILLLIFSFYNAFANKTMKLISLQFLFYIVSVELIFTFFAISSNIILAFVSYILIYNFVKYNKRLSQNIQYTILSFFGIFLCVFSWYFSSYYLNYFIS